MTIKRHRRKEKVLVDGVDDSVASILIVFDNRRANIGIEPPSEPDAQR